MCSYHHQRLLPSLMVSFYQLFYVTVAVLIVTLSLRQQ